MVAEVMAMHKLSQRRACGLIGITRRAYQFKVRADRNLKLRKRLRELVRGEAALGLSAALPVAETRRVRGQSQTCGAAVPGRRWS